MSYPSSPPEQKPKVKLCNNGCNTWIYWVSSMRYFADANTNERHICPNYQGGNKQQQSPPPQQQKINQQQQPQPTEHFTLEQIAAINKVNDNLDLTNQYGRVMVNTLTQILEELQRLNQKECNCCCGDCSSMSNTSSETASITSQDNIAVDNDDQDHSEK